MSNKSVESTNAKSKEEIIEETKARELRSKVLKVSTHVRAGLRADEGSDV
jgi:hypothetical protein